jgi:hypothetical protein
LILPDRFKTRGIFDSSFSCGVVLIESRIFSWSDFPVAIESDILGAGTQQNAPVIFALAEAEMPFSQAEAVV